MPERLWKKKATSVRARQWVAHVASWQYFSDMSGLAGDSSDVRFQG